MAKTDETKFGQQDFSGGFNSNSRINQNELQICENLDLDDFGSAKPSFQDTLIKSVTGVTNIQAVDGFAYYLVGTTLSRVKAGATDVLGTIGAGTFFVEKFGDIHIIMASDKVYKVITDDAGTLSLTSLGTAAPDAAPTAALAAQKSLQIDDFEDHTTWTASGTVKADNAVNVKQGTNSMKLTPSASSAIEYVTKTISVDLTRYADGTVSDDDDIITFWLYVNDVSKYSYTQIIFDVNTGDFANDMFVKTIPVINQNSNSEENEDFPDSFADPVSDNIDWDDTFRIWNNDFDANSRLEFSKRFIGKTGSIGRLLVRKQTSKKVGSDLGQAAWTNIKLRKSEFLRVGGDLSKGWDTVAAVKVVVFVAGIGIAISIDDLKMVGGGKLDADRYKLSYSHVSKYTLPDGTAYEEESKLSPEAEIIGPERQDISLTVISDSSDTQVTHKRIYIRGGGLKLRHQAGEIETGTTTFTTSQEEGDLVIEPIEDNRKNGVAPENPVHGVLANGKLFIAKGKNLSFSRTLLPFAFIGSDFITLPYDIKAVYKKGPNVAVLMENEETVYINPGFSAVEGSYLFDSQNPMGCISTRSARDGYHLSHDGIVFYRSQDPTIISDKIRQDLFSHSEAFREASVGAYLKGRYYLCIPGASVMYEFESVTGRFKKHTGIIDVAAKDGNTVFVLKSDGIYSFETDTTKRKAFAFQSPELVQPDSSTFHNLVIDGDLGADGITVQYFLNGESKTSILKTTSGRQRKTVPVSQEPGSRISAKLSTAAETTNVDQAIYGVFLQ